MKNFEFQQEQPARRVLQEAELAERWGMSAKTIQKWRQQGIGPSFMKLSARVVYPLELIEKFEANSLRKSTAEKA